MVIVCHTHDCDTINQRSGGNDKNKKVNVFAKCVIIMEQWKVEVSATITDIPSDIRYKCEGGGTSKLTCFSFKQSQDGHFRLSLGLIVESNICWLRNHHALSLTSSHLLGQLKNSDTFSWLNPSLTIALTFSVTKQLVIKINFKLLRIKTIKPLILAL